MHWGVDIDEAMFLGGLDKGEFLAEFEPDFYFDDHPKHVAAARLVGPTGHVMAGATNPIGA
jgi:5'-nucleotidase